MSVEQDEGPKKGRSNAILTYETISNVEKSLLLVSSKLDHVSEKVGEMRDVHEKHEVRIKALELAHAVVVAASGSSKNVWLWVWGAGLALPGSITAIVSLIRLIGGN